MARTALTPNVVTRAGITTATPASSDHTNGNSVANDGNVWIEATNSDTGPHTLTITPNVTVDGQTVTPVTHSIATTVVKRYGPFPVASYGSRLLLDTDDATLKLVAYKLGT